MKTFVICLVAMLATAPALAHIINVPQDYSTIQAGVDASVSGDTVLVASGTYIEAINFNGRSIALISQSGSDSTVLESPDGTTSIIMLSNGEGPGTIIEGFILQGINGNLNHSTAIFVSNGAEPLIKNNVFQNNIGHNGAAISILNGGRPRISDNVFANNRADFGDCIYIDNASADIDNNILSHCGAASSGGAIWLEGAMDCSLHHNLLYSNTNMPDMAAIFLDVCMRIDAYNNTIAYNSTGGGYGAGLCLNYSDSCRIYNNIICNNDNIGLRISHVNHNHNYYNDVWGNPINYYGYGVVPGEGSISLDPLFIGGEPYDFHLSENSPCVDAGDPSSPNDPDGSGADMGAFYPPHAPDYGYIAGSITNGSRFPVPGADVIAVGIIERDTTDVDGGFILGPIIANRSYDIQINHPDYFDTVVTDIEVTQIDTTVLNVILQAGIDYGALRGFVYNGTQHEQLDNVIVSIDNFIGVDTTDWDGSYLITEILPGLHDIYFSHPNFDSVIVNDVMISVNDTTILNASLRLGAMGCKLIYGNRDGSPMQAMIDSILEIPIWAATEPDNLTDSVTFMHLPLATNDSVISVRLGGYFPDTLVGRWDERTFWPANSHAEDTLVPDGWTNQTMLGFAYITDPPDPQNFLFTGGDTVLIGTFVMRVANNIALIGDTLCPFAEGHHQMHGNLLWVMQDNISCVVPQTTYPTLYFEASGCNYIAGDINGSGVANGLDVTYGVAFFKGGPPPPIACDMCPEPAPFYASGDVNGSCSFNGMDITYMVAYFKGGSLLNSCPDCPPARSLKK
jgi:hypothetical protein